MMAFIPLSEQRIRDELLKSAPPEHAYYFHILDEIDSTNRYLKDVMAKPEVQVCCAEQQSQGRGRFNRHWASPFGENIYLSCRYTLQLPAQNRSVLSLVVALAVLDSLKELLAPFDDLCIKWPNDLLWDDKKLCGILIEMVSEKDGFFDLVIGIGVNVNTDSKLNPLSDKACGSLFDITGNLFDRNTIIALMLRALNASINLLINTGFSSFQKRWENSDYLRNKFIHVTQMGKRIEGYGAGINQLGQLALMDEHGVMHYLSSGDTSLSHMRA